VQSTIRFSCKYKDKLMSLLSQTQNIEPRAAEKFQLPSVEPTHTGPYRDAALDFTKGALVLFMVLYHWLNYFIGPQGHFYSYLRFLTPSFIFITGFMISRIHLGSYGSGGRRLSKRLTVRGLKLLALVFLLNALVSFASVRFQVQPAILATFLRNIGWAFIVSNPTASLGQKSVAFSMLVPIAYLLILSAGLVISAKREKSAFRYALLALIVAVMFSYAYGTVSSYLDLLMIGVFGVVIGFAETRQITAFLSHPYGLIVLYCCYLGAITIWPVTLPLQVASVILTTALLYIAGSGKTPGAAWGLTVLLGKYSLLGYIAQIAILQGLRRISWFSQHGVGVLLGSLLLGIVLTLVTVEAADFARRKSLLADRLYRLVFA
jgi:peptidoglycan/LPS O-acetylase OafA/YrhL